MRQFAPFPSGRTSAILLEQWVRDVAGSGKCIRDLAPDVPQPVQELEKPLEQDNTRSNLQLPQAVHGDEPEAVRWMHATVSSRASKVLTDADGWLEGTKLNFRRILERRTGRISARSYGTKYRLWPSPVRGLRWSGTRLMSTWSQLLRKVRMKSLWIWSKRR